VDFVRPACNPNPGRCQKMPKEAAYAPLAAATSARPGAGSREPGNGENEGARESARSCAVLAKRRTCGVGCCVRWRCGRLRAVSHSLGTSNSQAKRCLPRIRPSSPPLRPARTAQHLRCRASPGLHGAMGSGFTRGLPRNACFPNAVCFPNACFPCIPLLRHYMGAGALALRRNGEPEQRLSPGLQHLYALCYSALLS
jgi:hypothetical protein